MLNGASPLVLLAALLAATATTAATRRADSVAVSTSASVSPTFTIGRTTAAVAIDGRLDERDWSSAFITTFSDRRYSDNSVTVFALYGESTLYLAFQVSDGDIRAVGGPMHLDDGIEVHVDPWLDRTPTVDGNDRQLIVTADGRSSAADCAATVTPSAAGYSVELAIPLDSAGAGASIGLLFGNNDRDGRRSVQFDHLGLVDTGDYFQPAAWDVFALGPPIEPATSVNPPSFSALLQSTPPEGPITVDGNLTEAAWATAAERGFSRRASSDNIVRVRSLWDSTFLYFGYTVEDANLETSDDAVFLDDGVELFLDVWRERAVRPDANDVQILASIADRVSPSGVLARTRRHAGGYSTEIAVPWTILNTQPWLGRSLGLLAANNDRDWGVSRQLDWLGVVASGNYRQPHMWGLLRLMGQPSGAATSPPEQAPTNPAPPPLVPEPVDPGATRPPAGACSAAISPSASIVSAFNALPSGGVLCLRAGTYAQAIEGLTNAGTSWDAAKTIRPFGDGPVIVRGGLRLASANARYLVIDGGPGHAIIFDGSYFSDTVKLTSSGTSRDTAAHHVRLVNCEIRGASRQGILTTDFSEYHEFIGNRIHAGGADRKDHGLYIATSRNLIDGNEIFDWSGYGIHIYNGYEQSRTAGQTADLNIVRSNLVHHNGRSADATANSVAGILVSSGDGNEVYNNLVWSNVGMGIQVEGCYGLPCGYRQRVVHNTIYGNTGDAIALHGRAIDSTILNNVSYQNGSSGAANGAGNFSGDPIFVATSPSTWDDLRLSAASPARDVAPTVQVLAGFSAAGFPVYSTLLVDARGATRQPGSIDMGALER